MGPGWILRKGSKRQKLCSVIRMPLRKVNAQICPGQVMRHRFQNGHEKFLFWMSNNSVSRFQLSYSKAFSVSINKERSLKSFQKSKFLPIIMLPAFSLSFHFWFPSYVPLYSLPPQIWLLWEIPVSYFFTPKTWSWFSSKPFKFL